MAGKSKRKSSPNDPAAEDMKATSARDKAFEIGRWPAGVYCEQTATEILSRISKGEPLRQICREDGMPSWDVFYGWVDSVEGFDRRFARARALGYDAIAADTLEIADDGRNDYMQKFDSEGLPIGWVLNGEHVQRSKLRIETRLKLLAKWDPKRYGEKLELNGEVKTSPDQVTTELVGLLGSLVQKRDVDT